MKRIFLGLAAIAAVFPFASCNTENVDNVTTVTYGTSNLIVPLDGSQPFASSNVYSFMFDLTNNKVSCYTSNLLIDNRTYSFVTDTVACKNEAINYGQLITIKGAKGYFNNDVTLPIHDYEMYITSLYNYLNVNAPGVTGNTYAAPALVGHYRIGDKYSVRTFSDDSYYMGTTTTSFPGQDGSLVAYENKDMTYRVVIDVDKDKADVVIYNAKFAQAAPELAGIILFGLDVKWTGNGYSIEGENVVPQVIEGSGSTPNDKYTFNKFYFRTTNDNLTQASIEYTVANVFKGAFSGNYLAIDLK